MGMNDEKNKTNSAKQFFSKIGTGISDKFKSVQHALEERKSERDLEIKLQKEFENRKTCQKWTCVFDNNKTKNIVVDVNYDKSTITLYGENDKIDKNCFFVDKTKQVFGIKLIRLKQETEIVLDEKKYLRPVTIIEYELLKDEVQKQSVETIINNTNISIVDSEINKSNIGENNDN